MVRELTLLKHSFSILGTKKLIVTDDLDGFLRLSDTGGLLGNPVDLTLSFSTFCTQSSVIVATADSEDELLIRTDLDNSQFLLFTSPRSIQLLVFILKVWDPSSLLAIAFPARVNAAELQRFKAATAASLTAETHSWLDAHLFCNGFVPIILMTAENRAVVAIPTLSPVDLPQSSMSLALTGSSLFCRNRVLIDNNPLNGFTLEFPTTEVAATYLAKTGLIEVAGGPSENQHGSAGLIGQVSANGLLAGVRIDAVKCDAQLGETTLTLCDATTNRPLCTLDMESPELAIDGTAKEFLISPSYGTALRVTSESDDFLHAVYESKATRQAATRTSTVGPYIAINHLGQFVRMENTPDGTVIGIDAEDPAYVAHDAGAPVLHTLGGEPIVIAGGFEFRAQLPTLEGIAATLNGLALRASVEANFEGAIAKMVGCEGQYLTYCVFGKLALAHIMIADTLGVSTDASFTSSAVGLEKESFLAILTQFALPLVRESETTFHYLPMFIVERDKTVLSSAGLDASLDYARAEGLYQSSLRACGGMTSHLYRIENVVSRLTSFRKNALTSEGWSKYAGLGASLAGSFVNPLMLVGAAQQSVSLFRQEGAKSAIAAETLADVFASCAQEWDYLMQTIVPFLSNRFAHDIYPIRLATADILLRAYDEGNEEIRQKLNLAVARRLGRLITFCEFPPASSSEIKRAQCVDFLFRRQQDAEGIAEPPF